MAESGFTLKITIDWCGKFGFDTFNAGKTGGQFDGQGAGRHTSGG